MTSEPLRLIAPLNKAPPEVERTGRAEVREEIVVDPETVNVPVIDVVANVETPEIVKAVADAFPKVD